MPEKSALILIDILEKAGYPTRIVGGAVRDALLARAVNDVDLATTALPQEMTEILGKANIKTAPTGIEHGTITAVLDHKGYEITTLREDIKTDGRHAVVTFTKDWAKDAARRDFTINALYRDRHGKIYDFVEGVADVKTRTIRFVGDPRARIREDYLRILRFFRFQAQVGIMLPDAAVLDALKENAARLPTLSRERIWKELSKLLGAPDPTDAWMLMLQHGIAPHILPEADRLATLCSLISYEHFRKKVAINPAPQSEKPVLSFNPLLRLAALLTGKNMSAGELQKRFALSSEETKKLANYLANPLVAKGQFDTGNLSFCLYRYGFDLTQDFLVLAQAQAAAFHWESARAVLEKWVPKSFPLRGEDVLALGLKPGPRLGEILTEVENWWMAQNFVPDRVACLAQAKKLMEIQ